jgi:hypothetical protein
MVITRRPRTTPSPSPAGSRHVPGSTTYNSGVGRNGFPHIIKSLLGTPPLLPTQLCDDEQTHRCYDRAVLAGCEPTSASGPGRAERGC